MKASLWLGPNGRHTVRFDEVELEEVARLMKASSYRQKVQVCDYRRNILGTWLAGELRDAVDELAKLTTRRSD